VLLFILRIIGCGHNRSQTRHPADLRLVVVEKRYAVDQQQILQMHVQMAQHIRVLRQIEIMNCERESE